jgi:hypothetical protein
MDPADPVDVPPPIDDIRAEREKASNYIKSVHDEFVRVSDEIRGKCSFDTVEKMREVAVEIEKNAKRIEDRLAEHKAYTPDDIDRLEIQINEWVEADKKAAAYAAYLKWKEEIETLNGQYEALTGEIETLRTDRKKTLAAMNLGIKGLEIGEDNFLYHDGALRGITKTNRVGNWSAAESVQVFFSIGACFAGQMKVLVVDNAESLDEATTAAVSKWAEKTGFLVILLKVANIPEELEEGIIYLVEGEVVKV